MTTPGLRQLAAFASIFLLASISMEAQQPGRMNGAIENGRRTTLPGRVPRHARPESDIGRVEATFELPNIRVHLQRTAAAQTALAQLLRKQQDPASPNFHKWLTPEQFGARFGSSDSD